MLSDLYSSTHYLLLVSGHLDLISRVFSRWLLDQTLLPLTKKEAELIELGFAYFSDYRGQEVSLAEPLVILALMTELKKTSPTFSIARRIELDLAEYKRTFFLKGHPLQKFITFYYVYTFGNDSESRLCDVFDFGKEVPGWAEQSVELVSVSRVDGQVTVHPFWFQECLTGTKHIGRRCSTVEETLSWFEDPSTVVCRPDELMGPDVVIFVRLSCGLVLPVFTQIEWNSPISVSNIYSGSVRGDMKYYMISFN